MARDVVDADVLNIFYGRCQSVCSHIVWCASLKLEWQALESGFFEAHTFNHFATTLIRRQFVEPLFLSI